MGKIDVFKIAREIFASGRIKDMEDWDEMQIELDYELSQNYGIEADTKEYQAAMDMVKERWYAEREEKPCLNVPENPFAACNAPQRKLSEEELEEQRRKFDEADRKMIEELEASGKVWDFGASMDYS